MSRHRRPLIHQSQQPRAPQPAAARAPQSQTAKNGQEQITTLSTSPIEEVDITDIASRDGGETEPAVDFADLEAQRDIGPPVKYYVVTRGGRVQTNSQGQRATIQSGKRLDDLNFDIPLMLRQGIEVREDTGESLDAVG